MDDRNLDLLAARAAGEPLPGDAQPSADDARALAEFEAVVGLLRETSVAPSATRRERVLQQVARPGASATRWLAVAAAVVIVGLAALAGAFLLNRPVQPTNVDVPVARGGNVEPKPDPAKDQPGTPGGPPGGTMGDPGDPKGAGGPVDWLSDMLSVQTGGPPEPVKASDFESGFEGSGGDTGGPRMGGSGGGPGNVIGPVLKQVKFKTYLPDDLPRRVGIKGAKVHRHAATDMGFDLVWIHYDNFELVEAAATQGARDAFEEHVGAQTALIEKDGTLILVVAPGFEPAALKKLTDSLKSATK